ncbi:class I SAM-dependent methyltransferase [Paenibacillus protaetiae]|nr:class I SAM-dependent methyltransferase [Paenibacillus protaetiae]
MKKAAKYEQAGVAMTCRSYAEYVRMFDLDVSRLREGEVLDIAAGGSSFTAELNKEGTAYAVDPRYGPETSGWIREAAEEIDISTGKLQQIAPIYDWSYYGSPEAHRANRMKSLDTFAAHCLSEQGRPHYVQGALPKLPFESGRFSLVLCSHFLFLYAEQFGHKFHIDSVLEMMRVCKPGGEVRIYPLVSLSWEPYPGLDELMNAVIQAGGKPELFPSRLPFIPGSPFFLRITN